MGQVAQNIGMPLARDAAHLMTKVPFNFKDQPANMFAPIRAAEAENLPGKRIQAATSFAAANRADYGDPGEKSTLANHQPVGPFHGFGNARAMPLADDKGQIHFPLGALAVGE
jgi:hypothetical protein